MNKEQFRRARALVRANGLYALRWLPADHARVMHALAAPADDYLGERAWVTAYRARLLESASKGTHAVRQVPCPSQRSAMHRATLERTYARHAASLVGSLVDCHA